jgi:hypothetical protein
MFQISKPSKAQVIKTAELVIVVGVATFASVWTAQPDPFTKAAVVASLAAAGAAIYGVIKSVVTNA